MPPPIRYRSPDEDSARWLEFAFREGDIVISTRSKSGTTWMQMICALLVFQCPQLPHPLPQLSPWLDWLGTPIDVVISGLESQDHRRFVKTHTPLDGIPIDGRAMYIVVARHPLDMAVSLYHQGDNLDRRRIAELTGQSLPSEPERPRPPLREWLLRWIDSGATPRDDMDSLPGVMWHLRDTWDRRAANVVMVHYADLLADLDGEMHRLAQLLGVNVADDLWPTLVEAAKFDTMRAQAEHVAPDADRVMKDRTLFFRRGSSGAGGEALSVDEMAHYVERARSLVPPDLFDWLHR